MELTEIAKDKAALETLASAYALVVCADAQLTHSEKVMFDRLLMSHSSVKALPAETLKFYFEEAVGLLRSSYRQNKPRILERIAELGDAGFSRKAIMALVRMAVVADSKVKVQEEAILTEIEQSMGLKTGSL